MFQANALEELRRLIGFLQAQAGAAVSLPMPPAAAGAPLDLQAFLGNPALAQAAAADKLVQQQQQAGLGEPASPPGQPFKS